MKPRRLINGYWWLVFCALCTRCFSPSGKEPSTGSTSVDMTTGATTSDASSSSSESSTSSTSTTTSTTMTSTSSGPKCGDGVVDEGEECDDMGIDEGDGCSPLCMKEFRRVFVTEAKFTGDLGGITGANESCQSAAKDADLPGAFQAWLSTADYSPDKDFVQSAVPYVLVDGSPIAMNWQDLVENNLLTPILLTEHGDPPPPPDAHPCTPMDAIIVWTNTLAAGGIAYADKSCADWTAGTQGEGHVGRADTPQSTWTQGCLVPCTTTAPLYCFEQ